MKAYSAELARLKRTALDSAWTITPVGGVDKVSAFMSLLYGNKLNVAVLTDFAKGQKKKVEDLRQSKLLSGSSILTVNAYTGTEEADTEDLIGRDGYIALVEQAYEVKGLKLPDQATDRIVKDVENAFRVLPLDAPEFDHFSPSSFLIENPAVLKRLPGYNDALNRFERLFKDLNSILQK